METVSQAMQFKHPDLLYALFLLVIPLIVHLFQLRKFRTEKFTNVKFLKKAIRQTRKSSQLKKWLVLFTRMLVLTSLVIAFAQPYFPAETGNVIATETVIYLDNSFSMQAQGKRGILLKRGIQDLLENLPEEGAVSFFTNSEEYEDVNVESLRENLQQLTYAPGQSDWQTVNLKAQRLFSKEGLTQKNFIAISDFQDIRQPTGMDGVTSYLVQLKPENISNFSIDSTYITASTLDETTLAVELSSTGMASAEVPVAIYEGERLLARKTVPLEQGRALTNFTFPTAPMPEGIMQIEDNSLLFDNLLFFSINEVEAVNVVVVGENESDFLRRIYTAPEFNLEVFPENNIDFNVLSKANLVILNEPENVNPALRERLLQSNRENVVIVVIPSGNVNPDTYNPLLQSLGLPALRENLPQEKLITDIAFDHPLYESVFDERVQNFQYPKVDSYYRTSRPATNVLSFDGGEPFLVEQKNNFLFSASLQDENSNFKNSPLVVPTFYNFGNLAVSRDQLYFLLGKSQEISLQANLNKDEILKLSTSGYTFIPRQQNFQNTVRLYLDDAPAKEGHYAVLKDSVRIKTLSFNLYRSESQLQYFEPEPLENVQVFSSVPDVFQKIEARNEVDLLWKWFVIFALVFLLTEMLILKYLK